MNAIEKKIARNIVSRALANGWTVSVNDGEVWTVKSSSKQSEIMNALASTDSDILRFRKNGEAIGSISLAWGNDEDLISDCTDNEAMDQFCSSLSRG